jgi:gustatory receptor
MFYASPPTVIIVCQFFGLFPLSGLTKRDLRKVQFKWKSLRLIPTVIYSLTVLVFSVASIYKHCYKGHMTVANLNGAIFYITSALSCTFFLTIDWRHFLIQWSKVEVIFLSEQYKHATTCMTLKRRIHICFFIGLATFFMNQLLFASSEITKTIHMMKACNRTKNSNVIEDYIVYHLDHIFNFIPYNHAFGFIGEFFNFSMSFYWTFPDIFIMLLSIGISHHFQQINKRIEFFKCRIISNEKWHEVRLHYTRVTNGKQTDCEWRAVFSQ